MKKIFILLISFMFITTVKADTGGREVIFTYTDNSFSTGLRTYTNNRSLISVSFKNSTNDLSPSMLSEILSQTSNTNAGKLYVYGTVKVKITPSDSGKYESLLNKESVYVGISDAKYLDSTSTTIDKTTDAVVKAKEFNYFVPVMRVSYRENTNDEWKTDTNFTLAESRTLESKLAELLSIDLDENPNGVTNAYNDLYKFDALGEEDTNTTRFDFYTTTDNTSSTDTTSNTNLTTLGSEYLIMKYNAPTTTTALIIDEETTQGNTIVKVLLVTILLGSLGGCSWYLKKKNIISFD